MNSPTASNSVSRLTGLLFRAGCHIYEDPLPCLIDAERLSLIIENFFLFKDFLSKTSEKKISLFPLFLT
jgi:hypothetical protein